MKRKGEKKMSASGKKPSKNNKVVSSADAMKVNKIKSLREEFGYEDDNTIAQGLQIEAMLKLERLKLRKKHQLDAGAVSYAGFNGFFPNAREAKIDLINSKAGYFFLFLIIFNCKLTLDDSPLETFRPSVSDYDSRNSSLVSSSHSRLASAINQWCDRIDNNPDESPVSTSPSNSLDTIKLSFPNTMEMEDAELESMTASLATTVLGDKSQSTLFDDEEEEKVDDVDSLGVSLASTLLADSEPSPASVKTGGEVAELISKVINEEIPDHLISKEELLFLIVQVHKSLLPKLALNRSGKPRNASLSSLVRKSAPKDNLALPEPKKLFEEILNKASSSQLKRISAIEKKSKKKFNIETFKSEFVSSVTLLYSDITSEFQVGLVVSNYLFSIYSL